MAKSDDFEDSWAFQFETGFKKVFKSSLFGCFVTEGSSHK